MISYFEYQEDFLKNAFEASVTHQITSLMHFYFMIQDLNEKLSAPDGGEADKAKEGDDASKDAKPDENKDGDGAKEEEAGDIGDKKVIL